MVEIASYRVTMAPGSCSHFLHSNVSVVVAVDRGEVIASDHG